jgi:hypothetical protein
MDIDSNAVAGSCPVIGPHMAIVSGQFLTVCAFALLP